MTAQSAIDIAIAALTMFMIISHIYQYHIKQVGIILIMPLSLMWVHVVGNYMQEQHWGPIWMQNHLHNLGVSSTVLVLATYVTLWVMYKRRAQWGPKVIYVAAQAFANGVLASWIIGTLICVAYEVLNVTIWRADAIKQGYSGRMDWPDMIAYAIGLGLMILNHIKIRPVVLARMRKELNLRD